MKTVKVNAKVPHYKTNCKTSYVNQIFSIVFIIFQVKTLYRDIKNFIGLGSDDISRNDFFKVPNLCYTTELLLCQKKDIEFNSILIWSAIFHCRIIQISDVMQRVVCASSTWYQGYSFTAEGMIWISYILFWLNFSLI